MPNLINFKDITGQKFGELTVVRRVQNNKYGQARWLCLCSCGNEHITQGSYLRNGEVVWCTGHIQTHCPQGHEFSEDNVYRNPEGFVSCKVCRNARSGKLNRNRNGWTPELFDKAWEIQKGRCEICGETMVLGSMKHINKASADHEHIEPPKPRGLLCAIHNTMLGMAQDDPKILEAGAAYLRKYGKV